MYRIGRKKPLMIAIALQSVTGFVSAFAPWYELFLIFKFICAVTTGGTMLVSFVLRKSSANQFKRVERVIYKTNQSTDYSYGDRWSRMASDYVGSFSRAIFNRTCNESLDILFDTYVVWIPNGCLNTVNFLISVLLVRG